MATRPRIPPPLQDWIDARRRHHLSHAQVQMARELGMNPKRLGKLDNRDQEPWKAPLPQCIEHLYQRRFARERPATASPPAGTGPCRAAGHPCRLAATAVSRRAARLTPRRCAGTATRPPPTA